MVYFTVCESVHWWCFSAKSTEIKTELEWSQIRQGKQTRSNSNKTKMKLIVWLDKCSSKMIANDRLVQWRWVKTVETVNHQSVVWKADFAAIHQAQFNRFILLGQNAGTKVGRTSWWAQGETVVVLITVRWARERSQVRCHRQWQLSKQVTSQMLVRFIFTFGHSQIIATIVSATWGHWRHFEIIALDLVNMRWWCLVRSGNSAQHVVLFIWSQIILISAGCFGRTSQTVQQLNMFIHLRVWMVQFDEILMK